MAARSSPTLLELLERGEERSHRRPHVVGRAHVGALGRDHRPEPPPHAVGDPRRASPHDGGVAEQQSVLAPVLRLLDGHVLGAEVDPVPVEERHEIVVPEDGAEQGCRRAHTRPIAIGRPGVGEHGVDPRDQAAHGQPAVPVEDPELVDPIAVHERVQHVARGGIDRLHDRSQRGGARIPPGREQRP